MDVTDGAAASSHLVLMDGMGSLKRRRALTNSGEIVRVPKGGYEAAFALSPGPDAKHMCTLCNKILRQPVQTKCGHRFCASCIGSMLHGQEIQCPELDCNGTITDSDLFNDTFAEREILNLEVVCTARPDGCMFSGKLRELEDHTTDCQYLKVVCGQNSCPERVPRHYLARHRQEACNYRFVNCTHCGAPVVLNRMQEHQVQCREWPVDCPQNCGMTGIPKGLVQEHLDKHCLLTVAPCRFAFVDCNFKGNRHELDEHLQSNATLHLAQLASLCNVQQRQLSDRSKEVTAIQTQLSDVVEHMREISGASSSGGAATSSASKSSGILQSLLSRRSSPPSSASSEHEEALRAALDRVNHLERRLLSMESTQSQNGVLVWRVENFSHYRRRALNGSERSLNSEPFYTSPHGYKLCARIYLNGDGAGASKFISFYIVIMKGEHDVFLQWPFNAPVMLSLLDQSKNGKHHHEKFFPDQRATSFGRPVGESNIASGCPTFFQLSALGHFNYIRDDVAVFRVFVDTRNSVGPDSVSFM